MTKHANRSAIEQIKAGDRLKSVLNAPTINAFKDAAQKANHGDNTYARSEVETGSTYVKIKNTTEGTINRFGVLGISNIVFTPTENLQEFKNAFAFEGTTPDDASHIGKFAIVQETLAAGKIGTALIAGVSVVKIYVNDEDHEWADVKDADATQLTSADSGTAQILWKESGEDATKWAVVRFMRREEATGGVTIQAQSFYSNASHSSALTITALSTYYTIPLDAYEGDNFISLSSDVMTTTTAGTYWVDLTPAWAHGNSSISSGDMHCVIWQYLEKYNGSTWDAVPMSMNKSNLIRITTINHVDLVSGYPDNWQSLEMPWQVGHSFPVFASANDQFRIRAAIVGSTYSRTSPGTLKAVAIVGNSGNYLHPYKISWLLVS